MSAAIPIPADSPRGFAYAMAAYLCWGLLPLYMKALSHIPATEVIAHRVLWSLPIAAAVLLWQRRSDDVRAALRSPRLLAMAGLTAALISVNWLTYVWAVGNGHALDAALGYYINPLFSVLLGMLFLGEKLTRLKMLSVALALSAVVILTVQAGKLPVVAVLLILSWGLYAYFKKSLPLGPNQGFTLEVLILTPFAAAFLLWRQVTGQGAWGDGSLFDVVMLLGCGPVTAIPLLFYANGAKLLRLSTIGVLQYTTPTMIFLIAVWMFNEPFGTARMIAFPLIWSALAVYTVALLREAGAARRAAMATTRRMQ
ncbi:EamA family transporter RarD [Paracoccus homiensis]|uniref:Chloramphenicol-sensitive protein RarD n=1 Tax=Paracoccus homiensis TaxID=364199 RepID=A0A1I0EJE5_9RHOB|nr:EamA family transporter RarD [Paracoccus homiensis]SET45324.1 chloramphenicol-sensitive protein RarD [Paracoccus homiensis]